MVPNPPLDLLLPRGFPVADVSRSSGLPSVCRTDFTTSALPADDRRERQLQRYVLY
jgi:hypothetical protein